MSNAVLDFALKRLRTYDAEKRAVRKTAIEHMRRNLVGPEFDYQTYTARRKHGRVFAAMLKRLKAEPYFYDSDLAQGPKAFDLSDAEVQAIDYHGPALWRIPDSRRSHRYLINSYKTCPVTGRHYYTLNVRLENLANQISPLEVHPSVKDTAVSLGSNLWFASYAEAEAQGYKTWEQLQPSGSVITVGGLELPKLFETKQGLIALAQPISSYHGGEERKNLQPDAAIRAGIELEFNSGALDSAALQDAASAVRVASDFCNIVEHDRSITGFEVITGHAEPHVLREQAVRPIFAHRPIAGLRTGKGTGMHVHVSKPENFDRSTFFESFGMYYKDYRKLANRTCNRYADYGAGPWRTASVSSHPAETFEFRLFKNPGNMPRVMANLQFAWGLVKFFDAGNSDYSDFRNFVNDGLLPEDTVELRAFWAAQDHKPLPIKELAKLYPRGQGIIGVERALST